METFFIIAGIVLAAAAVLGVAYIVILAKGMSQ